MNVEAENDYLVFELVTMLFTLVGVRDRRGGTSEADGSEIL